MKLKNTLMAVVVQLLLAGGACAQMCTPQAGALNVGVTNIDTCGSTNQLLSVCNGLDAIGATEDTIYQVNLAASVNGSVTVTPTGYDVKLALLQGTCSAGSTCIRDADANGMGGAESFLLSGLAPGMYFVLITSFGGAVDCGPTSILTIATPTPVTLQSFSVN